MHLDPTRVVINGRPYHQFANGTVLPVVAGGDGSDDDPDDDPDDDTSSGSGTDDAELRNLKTRNRRMRRQLQEFDGLKQELADLKKKDQTDTERLTGELAEARARADKAEAKVARYEVALDKGLTLRQANRLVGDTPEELEEDADDLLKDLKGASSTDTGDDDSTDSTNDGAGSGRPAGRPTESLRGGGKPDEGPEPDIRAIVDSIKPAI